MNRKLLIIVGSVVAILLVAILIGWWYVFRAGTGVKLFLAVGSVVALVVVAITKRKFLIATGTVVATLFIAIVIGWWYFFHTSAGVEFLLSQLNRVKGMTVVVRDVSGTLAGPLRVGHFELDMKYVRVVADNIELEPTPAALWAGTIRASQVKIGNAQVEVKAVDEPPSDKPLRFMPAWLSVSVGVASIDSAKVILPNGTALEAKEIVASDGMSLNADRLRVDAGRVRMPQGDVSGALTLRAQRPVGLDVTGEWQTSLGLSPPHAWHVRAQIGGSIQAFTIEAQLLSPSAASFSGTLTRGSDWRLEGAVASEQFALSAWLTKPPISLERIALQVDGSLNELHAHGTVLVPEVDSQPLEVDAHGGYSQQQLNINAYQLQLAASDTTAQGTLVVNFAAGSPNLDLQARWQQLRWPPRGNVIIPNGSMRMTGAMPYSVTTDAQLSLHPSIPIAMNASGELSKESIDVHRYELRVLNGTASGRASLTLDDARRWQASIDGKRLNPAAFVQEFDGAVDLRVQAQGQGFGSSAPWQLDIASLRGDVRRDARVKVSAQGSIGKTRVDGVDAYFARSLSATLGENRIALDGEVGHVNNLKWDIDVPRLDQVFTSTRGKLRMLGEAHGERAAPKLRSTLNAEELNIGPWAVTGLVAHADFDMTGDAPFTLVAGAYDASIGALLFDSLRLTSSGTTANHSVQLNGTMPAESYEVTPTIDVRSQGGYRDGEWRGVVSSLKYSDHYGREPKLEMPDANVVIAADRGSVRQFCIVVSDGKLCMDGTWDPRQWQADVNGDQLPLNIFDSALGEKMQLEGEWQLNGKWTGVADQDTRGDLRVRITDAVVLYEAVEDAQERVQVGTGELSVSANDQHWLGDLSVVTPGTTNLSMSARIDRAPTLLQAPLSARLTAHTSDANVLPLLFVDLDHAGGTLDADLSATGTLEAPSISGLIHLQRGELDLYRFNVALRAAELKATLADNHIDFSGSGRLGEGAFKVSGAMAWEENRPRGQLQFQGDNLLVADVPDYRVVASPNLRFAIDGIEVDVRGDVLIPSALLTPADLSGAVRRSTDVRLTGVEPDTNASQYRISSEINVRLGNDVRLKSFGLEGNLGGAVTTITRPTETARGQGELRVESGRFRAYGQDLNIERGRLLFDASPLENPGLDILATREIEDQEVGVYVRGTLRDPRLSFYSDPALSQAQTVAYLLTGKPIDDLSTQDAAAVGSATNTLALSGGDLLASQLGRRIGIEHVSVESSGLNDTSLVLGKFLSPRLFVSYGISLTESINTFKARYRLSDNWLLKGEAGQYQSADVEFRVER